MQEVRGSTPGREFFSPFLGRFVLFISFLSTFFFLPIDWFQFIHRDAPLQLHEMLR